MHHSNTFDLNSRVLPWTATRLFDKACHPYAYSSSCISLFAAPRFELLILELIQSTPELFCIVATVVNRWRVERARSRRIWHQFCWNKIPQTHFDWVEAYSASNHVDRALAHKRCSKAARSSVRTGRCLVDEDAMRITTVIIELVRARHVGCRHNRQGSAVRTNVGAHSREKLIVEGDDAAIIPVPDTEAMPLLT